MYGHGAAGTTPLIGVTKVSQVDDAVKAANIILTAKEIETLESLAKTIDVNTRGGWEIPME